jgi:simple sugar transport system permease protein
VTVEAVEILFTASLWAAAVRIASPLILATMGELLCERAGVLNLGIEGIMTAGAFAGWLTVYFGGDLWLGVIVAALAGAACCMRFWWSLWAFPSMLRVLASRFLPRV